ncbi:hypothetical protein [Azohydromonas australica]|uniref:hypothetical protein n=1 Tax=Azohydromonas australica TaxID=364039 RepID=UPI0005B90D4E|nr:hypothetical protein [Azohydromonas australica]
MHQIELSTVVFYEHRPNKLKLHECSLPLAHPMHGAFVGVYGTRSKPDAFVAARAHADRLRQQYTVVDLVVEIEHRPNPTVMRAGDLGQYDFFSMLRMASAMNRDLAEWIRAGLTPDDPRASHIDDDLVGPSLARDPSLLTVLADSPACRHLRLIACPVMTAFSDRALNVGIVPYRHWSAIKKATCRFDPTVQVTLEPPPSALLEASPASPVPAAVPRAIKPKAR